MLVINRYFLFVKKIVWLFKVYLVMFIIYSGVFIGILIDKLILDKRISEEKIFNFIQFFENFNCYVCILYERFLIGNCVKFFNNIVVKSVLKMGELFFYFVQFVDLLGDIFCDEFVFMLKIEVYFVDCREKEYVE